ncbi:hypothetical protein CI109_106988 [Kwoniella shandongensis]|uniref:Tetratricopeptide repeat protein 1 n=1 Tax=Kwoniella shandongensis TaxID=1734106 RepID=A0AAJ8N087_9TREE
MTLTRDDEAAFDSLPKFDARKFDPPAWANDPIFQRGYKNGESSKSATTNQRGDDQQEQRSVNGGDDDDESEDLFEDALSDVDPKDVGLGEEPQMGIEHLRTLLSTANELKAEGNAHFTAKPPRYSDAIQSYEQAKFNLPILPGKEEKKQPEPKEGNVIEEITDEEAAAIEANEGLDNPEEIEREKLEDEIRECRKACLGNLAACHLAMKEDQKAVEVCTEALEIDPDYVKGLHRRATASERIGNLTSLSTAKEDYTRLISLLPSTSPLIPTIRRSLSTLPERIKVEEKKQYDEMMGKLKDLGNSFLGNFGLSTDSFKFDPQPGGGYSMQFNR